MSFITSGHSVAITCKGNRSGAARASFTFRLYCRDQAISSSRISSNASLFWLKNVRSPHDIWHEVLLSAAVISEVSPCWVTTMAMRSLATPQALRVLIIPRSLGPAGRTASYGWYAYKHNLFLSVVFHSDRDGIRRNTTRLSEQASVITTRSAAMSLCLYWLMRSGIPGISG